MSRLSVLTVTAKPSRCSRSTGWAASEGYAPVCTLDDGATSSGTCSSRTRARQRPQRAVGGHLVGDADAVAEPLGARAVQGRPDRLDPGGLPGVDGAVRAGAGRAARSRRGSGRAGSRPRARRGRSRRRRRRGSARPARRPPPTGRPAAWRTAGCRRRSASRPRRPPGCPARTRRASPRRRPRSAGRRRWPAPAPCAPRRTRRRPRPGRGRTRARPGRWPRAAASPRRCARTSPGSAPGSRSRRPAGTSGRARRRRRRAARGSPASSASSSTVCGRSPPSRWSCSSTFGARRSECGVERGSGTTATLAVARGPRQRKVRTHTQQAEHAPDAEHQRDPAELPAAGGLLGGERLGQEHRAQALRHPLDAGTARRSPASRWAPGGRG